MAKDIIARLRADTKDYDANMAKARRSLEQFGNQNLSVGGVMQQGIRILSRYGSTLAVMGGAVKSAQKIIAGSQATTDEWGRSIEAAKRVTEGFFESLSRGNFDHFLSGLGDIISNARDAYDALDQLATFDVFKNMQTSGFAARRSELRANIRQGIDVEANKKALKELEKEEQAFYQHEATLAKNAGSAKIVELTGSEAGKGWITPYVKMGDAGQQAAAKAAAELKKQHSTQMQSYTSMGLKTQDVWDSAEAEKRYNALLNYSQLADDQAKEIADSFARANAAENQYWSGVASDARLMRTGTTRAGTGGGGSSRTAPSFGSSMMKPVEIPVKFEVTKSMKDLEDQMALAKRMMSEATDSQSYGAALQLQQQTEQEMKAQPVAIQAGLSTDVVAHIMEQWDSLRGQIQDQLDDSQLEVSVDIKKGVGTVAKQGNDATAAWSAAAQAVQNAGRALSATGNEELNVAGIIAQAIANVALGFAQASSSPATTATGIFGWIAAALAGSATMAATIASIKQATAGSYAEGGVIPGNSYSGDKLLARVNSGESVLTAQQAETALAQMDGGGESGGGGTFTMRLSGEHLVGVINNYGRRRGKGELIKL